MNVLLLDAIAAGLILLGMLTLSLAVIGMIRLKDYHERLHAAGMAGVMGVIPLLLASLLSGDGSLMSRAGLTIVCVLLTGPASLHALAFAGSVQSSEHNESASESIDRPESTQNPPEAPHSAVSNDEPAFNNQRDED
jgi:monovalent cation/proton antiporter MnhG/PhaG subunit